MTTPRAGQDAEKLNHAPVGREAVRRSSHPGRELRGFLQNQTCSNAAAPRLLRGIALGEPKMSAHTEPVCRCPS